MSVLATVNTFAVNYRGEPFTEPLRKNTMLLRSLQICYGVLFVCALEIFPPLNDLLQLTEFPITTSDEVTSWRVESAESTFFVSLSNDVVQQFGFSATIVEQSVRLEQPDGHELIARIVKAFPGEAGVRTLPWATKVYRMCIKDGWRVPVIAQI